MILIILLDMYKSNILAFSIGPVSSMAKMDHLADSMRVTMNIEEDERLDLLDETDDEDPTAVLDVKEKGEKLVIWAASKEKPKFIPKNKITPPTHTPQVAQPGGSQPAQNRLTRHGTPAATNRPVRQRLTGQKYAPYRTTNRNSQPPPPLLLASSVAPSPPSPAVYFPTPPPPKPVLTEFMISSLTNLVTLHAKDNFNIKLNENEIKTFFRSAKKEYCS